MFLWSLLSRHQRIGRSREWRNVKYTPTVIIDSSGNGDDKQRLELLPAWEISFISVTKHPYTAHSQEHPPPHVLSCGCVVGSLSLRSETAQNANKTFQNAGAALSLVSVSPSVACSVVTHWLTSRLLADLRSEGASRAAGLCDNSNIDWTTPEGISLETHFLLPSICCVIHIIHIYHRV